MRRVVLAIAGAALAAIPTGPSLAPREPPPIAVRTAELPRAQVDTADPHPSGRTIHVPAGGSLQKAIDDARGGDTIVLAAGATYRGPFHLPRKDGDGWIVIASDVRPPAGKRIQPTQAARMAKLVASTDSVIAADPGAHHYRLVALEIMPTAGVFLRHELVQFGQDETDPNALPHHLIVDRCYLHGDPQAGGRRGVAMNGRHIAVIDSWLADFKEVGNDSQAIAGWNGDGPFRIANNYLEGAGENVMFGGADPTIPTLVPADIEIAHNHLSKPLSWKIGDPSYQGTAWAIKNLFELKNARRVLVDGNVLEYNWPHAQNGFSILFTPRNQKGGAPWSVVEDVTFSNNVVRHVAAGFNMLGRDDIYTSEPTRRITIRNNLFEDVGGSWGSGRLFQLLDGVDSVVIDHNTAFQTGNIVFGGDHAPHTGFVFQNNIVEDHQHGVIGSGAEPGLGTLARYFPNAIVRRNVIVGGSAAKYPPDNFFPASIEEMGAIERREGRYRVALAHRFAHVATDGADPGADLDAVTIAANEAVAGIRAQRRAFLGMGMFDAATVGLKSGAAADVAFWAAFALLAYLFVGYPIAARVRASLFPKRRVRAPIEPTVTVVVVAYNEEQRIGARIENLLALDYPADRLDVVVASDGSTDGTVVAARAFASARVQVRAFFRRRGKPAVLNEIVPEARGEIVVLADARQRFEAGAVRALVANFADPSVGAASGELVIATTSATGAAGRGTAFYWRYEKLIRATESRGGSTVGATGAIYALRRDLFEPIPADTILDDVLIPMRVVRRGYSVVFERGARALDTAFATAEHELMRKVRTIGGTFQLFARERWLFDPRRNPLWFETMSHKALRLALPLLLALLFWANVALAQAPLYRWLMVGQLLFYAAALAGHAVHRARGAAHAARLLSIPYAIVLLAWATAAAFATFATGRQTVTWARPDSPSTSSSTSSPTTVRSPAIHS